MGSTTVFKHADNADGPEAGKVQVSGFLIRSTPRSVRVGDADRSWWFPRSQITIEGEGESDRVTVLLPPWLAKMKGVW